ncbi:hypothetical protein FEZ48_11200 [Marinilactibacillus psychrotolerans]|uniref:Cthe-2314-like HEPN domain-containing protein n=1 Tax=Marinilactibacillus psychrotolerans TaxID=191770 RepID=A0A5R9C057_9LACT|nr:hypothetical protein [Marinilactibacillus psychrotolerans]TLQ06051.1 hypothetical protein FEZ48_11200 [Marinilactibacillus psychrotolerans]
MKSRIEKELFNYKAYLEEYFPTNDILKKVKSKEFLDFFDKTLTLSKICKCLNSEVNKTNRYTNILEYNLNNLLYFLPLNELVSINMSVRNTTEYLIKLIYHLNQPQNNYLNTGYRSLSEDRDTLGFYNQSKNNVDLLFEIYSRRSNTVHLKEVEEDALTSILESKLTKPVCTGDLNILRNDINNCKNTLIEAILYYEVSLSTQQKIILKQLISKKQINKINLSC